VGGNVTYRPKARLLKLPSAPTVYQVWRGGTLRAIPDEATAIRIYGADRARRIGDLPRRSP
jgi:hypothetical protein